MTNDEHQRVEQAKRLTFGQVRDRLQSGTLSPTERLAADAAFAPIPYIVKAAMAGVELLSVRLNAHVTISAMAPAAKVGAAFTKGRKVGTDGPLRCVVRAELKRAVKLRPSAVVTPKGLWNQMRTTTHRKRLAKAGVTFDAGEGWGATPGEDANRMFVNGAEVGFKTFSNILAGEKKALRKSLED